MEVQTEWLHEDSLMGHYCLESNGGDLKQFHNIYTPVKCVPKEDFKPNSDDIQIKRVSGFYQLYCIRHNFTIRGENETCPDYPFDIPSTETFTLNQNDYTSVSDTRVLINPIEVTLNRQIQRSLKAEVDQIYGINITKFENENSLLEDILKSVPGNITLSDIPDALKAPFNSITDIFKSAWELIKKGVVFFAIIAVLLELALILPFIQILFGFIRIIISPLRRLRNQDIVKHWKDDYVSRRHLKV